MAMAGRQPTGDLLTRAGQIDEHNALATQDIAIAPLQRRAGDDARPSSVGVFVNPLSDLRQPRPTVFVVELVPGRHLVDIGRGVQIVTLFEVPRQAAGEQPGHRGLPAPRDTHQQQYRQLAR